MGRRAWAAAAVALILGTGVVAGCSGDREERFNTVGNAIDASDEATAGGGAAATEAALLDAGDVAQADPAPDALADRQVTYTGSILLRVDDAERAAGAVQRIADGAGGYLARSGASLEDAREVTLTLRVPSDAFEVTLDEVARLGDVVQRSVDSEDVTDQVVDLEGRLVNAEASAQRIRELLAKAEQVQNLIALEDRLTQRQTEIEALEGQLQVLDDRVALATLDVTVTERSRAEISDDVPGPGRALRAGVVALANVGQVALAAAAFSLPFLPFALVAWFVGRRWNRRARARREARIAALLPPPPEPVAASPLGGDEASP